MLVALLRWLGYVIRRALLEPGPDRNGCPSCPHPAPPKVKRGA